MGSEGCLYFTRLTVREDDVYLPLPKLMLARFANAAREIGEIQDILKTYRERFGVDLIEELKNPAEVKTDKRIVETGMYAAFAFFLENIGYIKPTCVAFYSSGIAPALVFSRSLTMDSYLEQLAAFHSENRRAYEETGERCGLAQVRLQSAPEENLIEFIQGVLREQGLTGKVFFKDRLHRSTCNVAGDREGVTKVLTSVCSRFSSIAGQKPQIYPSPSAHLPFYDHAGLKELLKPVIFAPPRFRLIGIQGEEYSPETDSLEDLRQLVSNAALGPINTGNVVGTAAKYAKRFVVVGSPRGASVFDRAVKLAGYPGAEIAAQTEL
jgi:hypothetical protein